MKPDLLPKLNWDIRLEPVIINSSLTGKRAIIRDDNQQLLGIVGKHYEPVSNSKFMQLIRLLTKSGEFELKGYDELKGGKIILAFLKNTNPYLKINGCQNEEYMFVGNSFDCSKRLYIGTASKLIRCANQFYSTLKVFSKKHTSNIEINDSLAQEIIRNYKYKKSILYESFDGMDSVRVDESVITRFIKEVHLMLTKDSKSIDKKNWENSPSMLKLRKSIEREMKDLGNNAFALFNGVTWYTTHELRSPNILNSQINGTANLINQKAFRFCINLKRNYKLLN
jgi:hypothetical protein